MNLWGKAVSIIFFISAILAILINLDKVKEVFASDVKKYKKECIQGDGEKCLKLGEIYQFGNSEIRKNLSEAVKAYKIGCEKADDGECCNRLGQIYENMGEYSDSFNYYKKSFKLLNPEGIFHLAKCYENGYGVTKNYLESKKYYKKACELNFSEACDTLERSYKILIRFFSGLNQRFNTNYPTTIEGIKHLKELDFTSIRLTSIPKEIGNLTNLKWLILWGNQLTSIPKEIGNLTNLKNLNLSFNKLTSMPKEIGNLTNLEYLVLIFNKLKSISQEVLDLKKRGCRISW